VIVDFYKTESIGFNVTNDSLVCNDRNKERKFFVLVFCSHHFRVTPFGRLGGVVVSVLATGPKGRGFKPGQGDGFLRAVKIHSTPFFGWEVKREGPMS
jgi:hypothetical protein